MLQRIFSRETELHEENVILWAAMDETRRAAALAHQETQTLKSQVASSWDRCPVRKEAPDPAPFEGKPGTLDDFLVLCRIEF